MGLWVETPRSLSFRRDPYSPIADLLQMKCVLCGVPRHPGFPAGVCALHYPNRGPLDFDEMMFLFREQRHREAPERWPRTSSWWDGYRWFPDPEPGFFRRLWPW